MPVESNCVIPAEAGIQSGFTAIRKLRLDSRLRGNDTGIINASAEDAA